MRIPKLLTNNRFWLFFFGLATIAGVVIGYLALVPSRPSVTCQVLANARFIDIKTVEGIDQAALDITILYNGKPLPPDKTISLISVKFVNDGDTNLVESDFASNDPLGFHVKDGKIADVAKVISPDDSEYLGREVKPSQTEDRVTLLSPIMFDKGKHFTIQCKVIHSNQSQPEIVAIGKISGIDEIKVVKAYEEGSEDGNDLILLIPLGLGTIIAIFMLYVAFKKDKARELTEIRENILAGSIIGMEIIVTQLEAKLGGSDSEIKKSEFVESINRLGVSEALKEYRKKHPKVGGSFLDAIEGNEEKNEAVESSDKEDEESKG